MVGGGMVGGGMVGGGMVGGGMVGGGIFAVLGLAVQLARGGTPLAFAIAKDSEFPAELERKEWGRPVEGLLITAGVTVVIANLLALGSIVPIGSAGFLIIYRAVNAGAFQPFERRPLRAPG